MHDVQCPPSGTGEDISPTQCGRRPRAGVADRAHTPARGAAGGARRWGRNHGMYTAPTATTSRGWAAPARSSRTGVDGAEERRQGDAQRRSWQCWQQAGKKM